MQSPQNITETARVRAMQAYTLTPESQDDGALVEAQDILEHAAESMMYGSRPLAFLDLETTGLDFLKHEITQIAYILRYPDRTELERTFYPEHTLDNASPEALEMTGYHTKIAPQTKQPLHTVMEAVLTDLDGVTLVGANISFDERFMLKAAAACGREQTWHHRKRNVEDYVSFYVPGGIEGDMPGLAACADIMGVPFDKDGHHDALYDAQVTRDVFEAVVMQRRHEVRLLADLTRPEGV